MPEAGDGAVVRDAEAVGGGGRAVLQRGFLHAARGRVPAPRPAALVPGLRAAGPVPRVECYILLFGCPFRTKFGLASIGFYAVKLTFSGHMVFAVGATSKFVP